MKRILVLAAACTLPGLSLEAAGSPFLASLPLTALLKEKGVLLDPGTPGKREKKASPRSLAEGTEVEARFGVFYPGPSSDTGSFHAGPMVGGSAFFALAPGVLEASLDVTSLKAPPDVDKEYQLLLLAGARYLFSFEDFSCGAGVTAANASPINEILLLTASVTMRVRRRVTVSAFLHVPAGNPNNVFMLSVCMGYRF